MAIDFPSSPTNGQTYTQNSITWTYNSTYGVWTGIMPVNDLISGNTVNAVVYNAGTAANAFASATIAGANTAVGSGANNFLLAVIAGANTAVGAGANNYLLATLNGANTAIGTGANSYAASVGVGANNYLLATIAGANTAVGSGANAFASVTIAGANTAVGTGANNYLLATLAGANTAVGLGANNYSNSTFLKLTSPYQTITGNLAITGSLSIAGNAYSIDTQSLRISDPLLYLAGNNYTSDIVDIGFVANYVNATGSNVHTGLFRDATIKEYYLFEGYNQEPEPNHIDPVGNNFTISTLNATLRTSNIILAGQNTINWITSAYNQANIFNNVYSTISGSNTAVGTGANAYAATVGTGANNYLLSVIAGANTAVGGGANTVGVAAFAKANAALPSSSYTAADVLSKLLTVDGTGSGLDADLLDGISSASFVRTDADSSISAKLLRIDLPASSFGNNAGQVNTLQLYQSAINTDAYITFHIGGDYAVHFGLNGTTNDLFVGGWSMGNVRYKIWHEGNDGSGSGLDADTLDGVDSANFVRTDVTRTISIGYTLTPANLGTISSGTTTLNGATHNYQYYTNNGAHTIAAPSSDCAIDILVTNGASAGAITFSGFTVQSGGTGDTYATTNTNKYMLSVRRINGTSTYLWKALQ